ncbi:hypothetical protein [Nevskia soli]|uniref:hypothetical protein n=1 Tax=Nevskia soli TaxID=418856 RepID=UPI0014701885|nr:hypothetical protein [Nevskia soli]
MTVVADSARDGLTKTSAAEVATRQAAMNLPETVMQLKAVTASAFARAMILCKAGSELQRANSGSGCGCSRSARSA